MTPRLLLPLPGSILLLLALFAQSASADFIWIEGEDADSESMQPHNWYDSVKKPELSGGEWLSHFSGGNQPTATYRFEVAEGGEHEFWLRANPIAAAMGYRLNGGQWQKVDLSKREQSINIASDGKPDLRFVAWIDAGTLPLKDGGNTLEIRFESGNNNHGGLDAIVLSGEPFFPQGNRKPGEKTGLADPGTWAFEPDRDRFSEESLLDLSHLNEKPAGKNGYVRRSADGADFVDGAGESIRFWAVNTGVQSSGDRERIREHAKWLAKRGVNMVRHHGHLQPGRGSKLTDVNQQEIDRVWKLVAEMKEEGIYTTVSPYWASHVQIESSWNLKDPANGNLTGLLFFDKDLQNAYKGWLRALLEPENPYTGVPLAEDPALAIFQIQNEDSLLFWTEGSIKGEQRRELGRQFGEWLSRKYGSIDKAVEAWGGPAGNDGDDFRNGVVLPHIIWHMTQDRGGALASRLADQLEFYTTLMAAFNREIQRYLHEDLGYKGLVNAGNWRTADQAKLLDAERLAYSVNDVIGINRYYNGGSHENPTEPNRAGYLISKGDLFSSRSVLEQPWSFPLALRQVAGHPMIISESAWVPPLRYQTEGAFLVSAYGSLTGFDIFYWFATGDIGFGAPMDKWQLSTPAQLGMFPAAALMFREGYVKQGEPVIQEQRSREDLWARKSPLLPEEAGFDPNRDAEPPASGAEAAKSGSVTPLAYLVGPVEVSFSQDESKAQVADINRFIDPDEQTVVSNTGQLRWNYDAGICTLDAPKAQGATGNLAAAGAIRLSTLNLKSENEYATVMAVSMDGKDLDASSRVLLQIGTTARPYGWKTRPAGDGNLEITDIGSSPWNIQETKLELILRNDDLSEATLLDANGVPVSDIPTTRKGGALHVKLPPEAMYVLLR